jgi:hypothetical protein
MVTAALIVSTLAIAVSGFTVWFVARASADKRDHQGQHIKRPPGNARY